jgi:hypothetical protein
MLPTIHSDLWDYLKKGYNILIPTNGYIASTGHATMGRGVALQAAKLFKNLDIALGKLQKQYGNHVFYFERQKLIMFPTKNHWKDNSDLTLINTSCLELKKLLSTKTDLKIVMPKIGCGNGKLKWGEISPIIEKHFSDLIEKEQLVIVDNEQGDSTFYRGDNKDNIFGEPENEKKPVIIEVDDKGNSKEYTVEDLLNGKA